MTVLRSCGVFVTTAIPFRVRAGGVAGRLTTGEVSEWWLGYGGRVSASRDS